MTLKEIESKLKCLKRCVDGYAKLGGNLLGALGRDERTIIYDGYIYFEITYSTDDKWRIETSYNGDNTIHRHAQSIPEVLAAIKEMAEDKNKQIEIGGRTYNKQDVNDAIDKGLRK